MTPVRIIRAIVSVVVLLLASGAAFAATQMDSGFKFSDAAVQGKFVQRLKEQRIAHSIAADGTALYRSIDEARVSTLRMELAASTYVPSLHVPDPKVESRLTAHLSARGIPFAIQVKGGKRWVVFSEHDEARVKAATREILEK